MNKQKKKNIKRILREYPETRNSETELIIRYAYNMGKDLSVLRAISCSTIGRIKRQIQEEEERKRDMGLSYDNKLCRSGAEKKTEKIIRYEQRINKEKHLKEIVGNLYSKINASKKHRVGERNMRLL